MAYFASIIITGVATGLLLALVLLRSVSGSLLAAMGEACGGIFAASHGFLAASNWNYLFAIAVATIFIPQLAFLVGGGARLLKVTHSEKKRRRVAGISCPALSVLARNNKWASRVSVLAGEKRLEAQTVGLLKPRILLSAGIVRALNPAQLEAVLAHEEAHRVSRDNLVVVLAKTVTLTLFYLPGPRLAFRELRAALERAADLRAAGNAGGRLAVADALAKIAAVSRSMTPSPRSDPILSAAVTGSGGGLTTRLEALLISDETQSYGWRRLALFAAGTAAVLTIFATSALAVAGSDQRQAFICFTQHEQSAAADGVCNLDHPDHP